MPRKSATSDLVRMKAQEVPPATEADLARLRAGMNEPVDTSEIPEKKGAFRRITRDASGHLPQRRESPIRRAILDELERRKMTRYQLWQAARVRCATLPRSAVYEYLRGQREIGLPYAEALMEAVGLVIGPRKAKRPGVGSAVAPR